MLHRYIHKNIPFHGDVFDISKAFVLWINTNSQLTLSFTVHTEYWNYSWNLVKFTLFNGILFQGNLNCHRVQKVANKRNRERKILDCSKLMFTFWIVKRWFGTMKIFSYCTSGCLRLIYSFNSLKLGVKPFSDAETLLWRFTTQNGYTEVTYSKLWDYRDNYF